MNKRTSNQNRTRRQSAAMARRRRRRKVMAVRLLLLLVAVGIVVSALAFFRVAEVKVEGQLKKYTAAEVKDVLAVEQGNSLLLLSSGALEKKLLDALPYLEGCSISKSLSGVVTVKVSESDDFGAVKYGSSYIVVNGSLRIIEVASRVPSGAAVIYGFDAKEPVVGELLQPQDQDYSTEELQQLLNTLFDAGLGGSITAIGAADRLNLVAVYNGRIYVEFGTINSIDYKVRMLLEVVGNRLSEQDEGRLDLATPGSGVFSTQDIDELLTQLKKS